MNKKLILVFILPFLSSLSIYCQHSFNSSGKTISSTTGSLSYSVGQVILGIEKSSSANISEGVLQPQEIFSTLNTEFNKISLKFSVYPNPTTDNLVLSIKNHRTKNLTYVLYDILGKKLETNKVIADKTLIDMKKLPNTFYFLKVLTNNKQIKIFKIIKN